MRGPIPRGPMPHACGWSNRICNMNYLSPDDVRKINLLVIRNTGGTAGAVNEANLHHLCERAKRVRGGLIEVASYYLHAIAYQAHAFTDGNKRTAIQAALLFLLSNDRALEASEDELVGMALLVATGEIKRAGIEKWLRKRVNKARWLRKIFSPVHQTEVVAQKSQ